eukprot:TRINITY_DN62835_c0_g1_i1.p1 TRINITY_DN62835_c0_g1~~TRINITY_DN62835_c0_g1_i1.p1  ORF type:complete len:298 (-),score=42.93 TRINITY_DN62835_c0_g1_i1:265-1158(-)
MAFTTSVKKLKSGAQNAARDDVEGLTVSLGVIYALLLPTAMALQNMIFDDGIQAKNFLYLVCSQPSFRSYVVDAINDGVDESEMFDWNVTLGSSKVLNTKAVLQDNTKWQWDLMTPDHLYDCAQVPELSAAATALQEHWPVWRTNVWSLMNPDAALWSDHLNAMCSFAAAILMSGLLGSLLIYISLVLACERSEQGVSESQKAWNTVGFPLLALDLFFLIGGIVVLLFANDAYSESQDVFFVRDGRMAGYSKLAQAAVFAPILVLFIVGCVYSAIKACRSAPSRQELKSQGLVPSDA